MKQTALAIGIVLVLVGAAVVSYMSVGTAGTSAKSPLDMQSHWICLAENEPHDFMLTVRDIARFPDGVTCSVCNSAEISRALPCHECGRHYPIGRYNASPTNCMHCGVKLDGAEISTFHGSEGH